MPSAPKQHRPKGRDNKRTDNRRPAHKRLYDHAWHKLAERHKKENPKCVMCLKEGIVTAAEIADHIIPVHAAPDRRLDETNLQSLCRRHHTIKTNEDLKRYGSAK